MKYFKSIEILEYLEFAKLLSAGCCHDFVNAKFIFSMSSYLLTDNNTETL